MSKNDRLIGCSFSQTAPLADVVIAPVRVERRVGVWRAALSGSKEHSSHLSPLQSLAHREDRPYQCLIPRGGRSPPEGASSRSQRHLPSGAHGLLLGVCVAICGTVEGDSWVPRIGRNQEENPVRSREAAGAVHLAHGP
ncbi:hypothetical protein NDU88_004328 [Pleurodeles waltl]|uniref:Uncharacterized protein n=1 Tax=Pleurodeles waltl TaxID=8319 RepID=A0AAV7QE54_PLEWA|nr:hypothetical protein NDU88_004328 [Pleurodeles waltl]